MNQTVLILIVASGVALCALPIVAGGLIRISLKRAKSVAGGGPEIGSRMLDDLRPVETLLVEFVRHSPEMSALLTILSPRSAPTSFARLVHEIRMELNDFTDPKVAGNFTGPALGILGLVGLIRMKTGGFVITEVGCEVQKRVGDARPPETRAGRAALIEPEERADSRPFGETPMRPSFLPLDKQTNIMKTSNRNIIMTADDHAELNAVITFTGNVSHRAQAELAGLERELKRAKIVAPEKIPSDVITLNSCAELLDLKSEERMEFTLVLPRDADIEQGRISVLAPLGTAMIGYRNGDTFEWPVPSGHRRLKVTALHFQPEASLKKAA